MFRSLNISKYYINIITFIYYLIDPLFGKNSVKVNSMKDRFDFVINSTRAKDFRASGDDHFFSTNFSHNFKKSKGITSSVNIRKSNVDFLNNFAFDE